MQPLGKQIQALGPVEVTGGVPATSIAVDTLNADLAIIDLVAGTQTGTDAPTVLKLTECAEISGEYADVAAFLGGTAFDLPKTL